MGYIVILIISLELQMSLYFCCQWCMTGQFKQAQNKNISIALYWLYTLARIHHLETYLTRRLATWLTLAQIHHFETYPHTKTSPHDLPHTTTSTRGFPSHKDVTTWFTIKRRHHHTTFSNTKRSPYDFFTWHHSLAYPHWKTIKNRSDLPL